MHYTEKYIKPSDVEILVQLSSGEMQYFDVFVNRYAGRLISYFRSRIPDTHIAEDLSQESLMRVFRAAKSGKFRGQGDSAASWVFTIARNCMVEHIRSSKRHPLALVSGTGPDDSGDNFLDNQPTDAPGPFEQLTEEEHRLAIIRILEKLPDAQQEVVRLKIYGGLTFKQISEMLDCPLTTVKSRMQYALNKIHQLALTDSKVETQ